VASRCRLQEGVVSASRASSGTSRPPRSCSPFKGRRQEDFVKIPLTLEGFLGKTKHHPFSLFGDSNYSEVFKINMDFLT
jgi:hypothetical protein